MSDTGHGVRKEIKNNPFDVFNNFNIDQFFVQTEFNGLKRRLSSQITGK